MRAAAPSFPSSMSYGNRARVQSLGRRLWFFALSFFLCCLKGDKKTGLDSLKMTLATGWPDWQV